MKSTQEMSPLGAWVQAWAKHYGHTGGLQQELLRNDWEQTVGPHLASRTQVFQWDGGPIIRVRMSDAAAQQEVHLRQREWIESLRCGEGRGHLLEIRTF